MTRLLVCSTMRKIEVFKKVLIHTNTYLEENFAFKLVPLPVVSASVNVPAKTNRAKKSAVAQANKMANSKTSPPQMYSLVSTFTQKERSKFPATSRDPLRLAIIHTTLMIIKLSGNNVDRPQLVKALHEIQMCKTDSSELPLKDLDAFLEQLKKEKYILKERKNVTETEPVYSWGPRAFIEFPPKSMTDFLCTVNNGVPVPINSFFRLLILITRTTLNPNSWKRFSMFSVMNK